jgi:uncharacterized protein YndB with AHSA1/START domain
MSILEYEQKIEAPAPKIWQVLWQEQTYSEWTSVFNAGSYAISDFTEGSEFQFLSPNGSGVYGHIAKCVPNAFIEFQYEGEVRAYQKIDSDFDWKKVRESYRFIEDEKGILLSVSLVGMQEHASFFNTAFPKALLNVKKMAEEPLFLTVDAFVKGSLGEIWELWVQPNHIMEWNHASDDWHTPFAENELKKDGQFCYRMAAKDGSVSFDFKGIYSKVIKEAEIAYTIEDGRLVTVTFEQVGNQVHIQEKFEAETLHSLSLQEQGWNAILAQFKRYAESNIG